MPIYEYECTHCAALFEAMQKVSDAPLTHCDVCGQETAKRLMSAAGFQLKGTGWYATDFKDKPKPAQNTQSESTPAAPKAVETTVSSDTAKKDSQ